jgi:hypothetical protein
VGLNIVTLEAKEKSWFEAKLAEGLMAFTTPIKIFNLFWMTNL